MIELGNILIRDNISLVEARNKIRFLGQDLKYSSMSIIQLTTITSEIIRSIGPTEKEEVRMIVGFEEKETKYGLVLQFQSKKKEINLSPIKTFFDKVQILPLKNGLQRIITFKHIPDSTFRPTDEFIEEEKERIIRFSRAELLSEVEKKNEELLKLLDERKKAEKTLRHSQQEFSNLFKNSPEALVYLDEKSNIVNINPRFTKLFGYALEEIKGRNINDGMIHLPDKIEEGGKLDEIALSKAYFSHEGIRRKKDGTSFPVSIASSNIKIDGQVKGILVIYIDITERKKLEEKLKKLAHYDVLTGCCSRGYGLNLLEQQIKTAKRKKTPVLLLYLDVDDFKHINDTFGHKEGDEVLKEAAQFFKSTLREVDIICRIGGDEFLLIFPDSSLDDVLLIKERINKRLKELNENLNKPYTIDFSIGISVYDPANSLSIDELIRVADENMYKEKKSKNKGRL